jgi:hypothetical protein
MIEIQALKLRITEQALDQLIPQILAQNPPMKELRVRLTPEGANISGVYHMVVNVPFEAVWELSVQAGEIAARLGNLKVSGLGGGMLKPALLSALREAIKKEEGIRLDGETLLVDLDKVLAKHGLILHSNLKAIHCGDGYVVVESAAPAEIV